MNRKLLSDILVCRVVTLGTAVVSGLTILGLVRTQITPEQKLQVPYTFKTYGKRVSKGGFIPSLK